MSRTDDWNKDIRDPIIFDPTLTIARFVEGRAIRARRSARSSTGPTIPRSRTSTTPCPRRSPRTIRTGCASTSRTACSRAETQVRRRPTSPASAASRCSCRARSAARSARCAARIRRAPAASPVTDDESHAMDQAIGTNAAARALTALRDDRRDRRATCRSRSRARRSTRASTTRCFHVAFLVASARPARRSSATTRTSRSTTGNAPWLPLRATYLQIGPLGIVTAPGELHPELWVGGYDGSWSWGWPLLNDTSTTATRAEPAATSTRRRSRRTCATSCSRKPACSYPVLAGLAEDYIGYIVPAYNYVLIERPVHRRGRGRSLRRGLLARPARRAARGPPDPGAAEVPLELDN